MVNKTGPYGNMQGKGPKTKVSGDQKMQELSGKKAPDTMKTGKKKKKK